MCVLELWEAEAVAAEALAVATDERQAEAQAAWEAALAAALAEEVGA